MERRADVKPGKRDETWRLRLSVSAGPLGDWASWCSAALKALDAGCRDAVLLAIRSSGDTGEFDPRVQLREADRCAAAGRVQEAVALTWRVVASSPTEPPFWAILAGHLETAGQAEEALLVCDVADRLAGASRSVGAIRALTLYDDLNPRAATRAMCQSLRLTPHDKLHRRALSFALFGNSLVEAGRFSCAVRSFEHALSLDESSADAWFRLGHCLRGADPSRAEACLREAARLAPEDFETQAALAWAHTRRGDFTTAVATLRRTAPQSGTSQVMLRSMYLGEALDGLGCRAEAEQAHRAAVDADLTSPLTLWHLADFLVRHGERRDANIMFGRAEEMEPDQPKETLELMQHLWHSGRRAQARPIMERHLRQGAGAPWRAWVRARLAERGPGMESGRTPYGW